MSLALKKLSLILILCLTFAACGSDSESCEYSDSSGFAKDCDAPSGADSIRLNEFSSSGDDSIEILNIGDSTVDIGTWILTDDVAVQRIDEYSPKSDEEKFVFPSGTVIPAKGYVVIPKGSVELAHLFGISKKGDIISLVAPNGELIDQAQSTDKSAKPSYCRVPDGTGDWQTCEATFGSENIAVKCGNGAIDGMEECDGSEFGGATCSSVSEVFTGGTLSCTSNCTLERRACETNASCDADSLVLNEVCHKNLNCGVTDVTSGDWLEIYNSGDSEASVGGCSIRVSKAGEVQLETRFVWIPGYETLSIPSKGFVLINDVEDLFDAGSDEDVYLLDSNGGLINGLATSTALSVDGDSSSSVCTIDQEGDTPTPGESNQCTP